KVDWFLKADDDTYVIVENLRYFLSGFNTSEPLYFGHKFKTIVKNGFFSGGAGYALSKEATRRFVTIGYHNASLCRKDHGGAEDVEMANCMEKLNVSAMDTRDSQGRGRFFPFGVNFHYFPGEIYADVHWVVIVARIALYPSITFTQEPCTYWISSSIKFVLLGWWTIVLQFQNHRQM
ncbi:Uncharacterized protein APZ42_000934, partial [Daphnia magna]